MRSPTPTQALLKYTLLLGSCQKSMTVEIMAQMKSQIRYVTNADGETTDVLVPIEIWQQLVISVNSDKVRGLAWIDEHEPKPQILADLQESVRQAAARETFPVSELWDDIEG